MATFSELGIPFPLFEAPVSEASEYSGKTACVVCGGGDRHCFRLDIGCDLVVSCPGCGGDNGLDANDRKAAPCRVCGSEIPFPGIPREQAVQICYACLRAGKGAITTDTEFGMVSWEQAVQGVTHGVPGLATDEFERVLVDPEDDWYAVRVPKEHLFELLRTPTFNTWQGERWLFCCKRPMTYIGEWPNLLKSPHRPESPREFFETATESDARRAEVLWKRMSGRTGSLCVYTFHCKECGRYRATWDMD